METVLIENALSRIAQAYQKFGSSMFIGHSGGKDSCVILHLTQQIYPNITIVHNVKPILGTSGDPVAALTEQHPKTLEFLYTHVCRHNQVRFMHSSMMPDFVKARTLKCQVDGARRSEWSRPGKSSNIIVNGENVNRKDMPEFVENGIFNIALVYPIVDWEDKDVFDYLITNDIPFSDEYRENGELEAHLKNA